MKKRGVAEYFEAVAEFLRNHEALSAWAAEIGQPPPPVPVASQKSEEARKTARRTNRVSAKRANSRRIPRSKPTIAQSNGNGHAPSLFDADSVAVISIEQMSRPQACLAILRLAGKPLTTEAIVAKAEALGFDWGQVSGGPPNAVHGALWRERTKGNVLKKKGGPWELLRSEVAPVLDVAARTATLPADRMPPQILAHARRRVMLEVLGTGRMTPIEILQAMRKRSEYKRMPRHMVREDLDALITDGKAEKTDRGLYRGVTQ